MIHKILNKIISYIKKHGIKAAIGVFIFYLIRDVSIYIILPWLIAQSIL